MSKPGQRPGFIVAVASGKGGTGKTTVATSLAVVAAARGLAVQLADCDVEEPNAHLFLKPELAAREPVLMARPSVDAARCTGCGACAELCQFNAIACVNGAALVFAELCHGCGGCWLVCPEGAMSEARREVGTVEHGRAGAVRFVHGRVNVGEAAASPTLVRQVKAGLEPVDLAIVDAPPGTTCPTVAALRDSDFACLVTEPTPFGLHDLKLAVETTRQLDVPLGVVINRADIGDGRVRDYCEHEGIRLLGEIPHDVRIAQAYSRGAVIAEALPELAPLFEAMLTRIHEAAGR